MVQANQKVQFPNAVEKVRILKDSGLGMVGFWIPTELPFYKCQHYFLSSFKIGPWVSAKH